MKTILGLALALALTPALADGKKEPKAPRQGSVRVIPSGSEESPTQRERRLLRECKGRPNAGACLGFAS